MIIYQQLKKVEQNLAVAIGFFDGIHIGHKKLIDILLSQKNIYKTSIFTFRNHPDIFLKGYIEYILTDQERIEKIKDLGIDYLYLIEFNKKLMSLSAAQFIDILTNDLCVKKVIVGYDFTFGYMASGNAEYLCTELKKRNVDCIVVPAIRYEDEIVSSTAIREYIKSGNMKKANAMLGYNFFINGKVIKGKGLGREIGVRTVNLRYNKQKVIPLNGVYLTYAVMDNERMPSITNVGFNPTVDDDKLIKIETHILDKSHELYNKEITIEFIDFLRKEEKFDSLEDLRVQIMRDIEHAKNYFDTVNSFST